MNALIGKSVHRVNVNFSEGAYRDLTALAERQGHTVSDVIRRAIALEMWFDQTQREGGRVIVGRNGRFQEVVAR